MSNGLTLQYSRVVATWLDNNGYNSSWKSLIDWVINEKVAFILDHPLHSYIPECKIGSYNDLALHYVP